MLTAEIMITTIAALLLSSLLIRQLAILCDQQWVKTYSHTTTILLLPVLTYVITSVISGNLTLSLGMVGALSIIRFRNPVKSPFELVIYFMMITLGISASVSLYWLSVLMVTVIIVMVSLYSANRLYIYWKKHPLFVASFTEGNSLNVLEITSTDPIEQLANKKELMSYVKSNNLFIYRLASANRDDLVSLAHSHAGVDTVVSVRYTSA